MLSYLVPWLFLLFWVQCTHAQLNPFYHPFYPDVTHMREDTRPSPTLPYWKRRKAGRGLGTRLGLTIKSAHGGVNTNHQASSSFFPCLKVLCSKLSTNYLKPYRYVHVIIGQFLISGQVVDDFRQSTSNKREGEHNKLLENFHGLFWAQS